jgi:hypothetical protein
MIEKVIRGSIWCIRHPVLARKLGILAGGANFVANAVAIAVPMVTMTVWALAPEVSSMSLDELRSQDSAVFAASLLPVSLIWFFWTVFYLGNLKPDHSLFLVSEIQKSVEQFENMRDEMVRLAPTLSNSHIVRDESKKKHDIVFLFEKDNVKLGIWGQSFDIIPPSPVLFGIYRHGNNETNWAIDLKLGNAECIGKSIIPRSSKKS